MEGERLSNKNKKKIKNVMLRANRLVVNATSLKPTSFGFAGSNPASRIFFVHWPL